MDCLLQFFRPYSKNRLEGFSTVNTKARHNFVNFILLEEQLIVSIKNNRLTILLNDLACLTWSNLLK